MSARDLARRCADAAAHDFDIRWFTPTVEVALCGHATLASAAVIFRRLGFAGDTIRFRAQGGDLVARRHAERIALDFPAWPSTAIDVPAALSRALGAPPRECLSGTYMVAAYATAGEVAALAPDMAAVTALDVPAIVATAEDPVTGSAHCQLVPYWAARLDRTALSARQISPRGGSLACRLEGDRVVMAGHAVEYLRGTITV